MFFEYLINIYQQSNTHSVCFNILANAIIETIGFFVIKQIHLILFLSQYNLSNPDN